MKFWRKYLFRLILKTDTISINIESAAEKKMINNDPTYQAARAFVLKHNAASVAILQGEFRLGYAVASQIISELEIEGIISPARADSNRLVFDPLTKQPLTHTITSALLVNTLIGNENRHGGLMLCGINHGRTERDEALDAAGISRLESHKSFFGDEAVENYQLRNRIVSWFKLWGYKLNQSKDTAGNFEKSIVYTNWLQSTTKDVKHLDVPAACIADCESFLQTCEILTPRVIFFFSKNLLSAFTSNELSKKVQIIFGAPVKPTTWRQENVVDNGRPAKAFKVGFAEYEHLKIISLPHPTGSQGLSDKYIEAFKTPVAETIGLWWAKHEKRCAFTEKCGDS